MKEMMMLDEVHSANEAPEADLEPAGLPAGVRLHVWSGRAATFTTVAFDHSSLRWLEINT
jgi:hypothetical protein